MAKLSFVFVIAISCKQENPTPSLDSDIPASVTSTGVQIILGEQLINPYTVQNALDAFNELKNDYDFTAHNLNIRKTHRYIRFDITEWAQLDSLENDTSLILFEVPLDRPIIVEGDYYRPPGVSIDKPAPQYTVVDEGDALPQGVPFTELAALYIPDKDLQATNDWFNSQALYALDTKMLERTGNLPDTNSITNGRRPARYNPRGKIQFKDNFTNTIKPVKFAEIRVHNWFNIDRANTQMDGSYYVRQAFRYAVRHKVIFEGEHYTIREGFLDRADILGPDTRGEWHPVFTHPKETAFCIAHNASFDYYNIYRHVFGVNNPPFRSDMYGRRLKLSVRDGSGDALGTCYYGSSNNWQENTGAVWQSDIQLYDYNRPHISYYSTVIHELAHAAHFMASGRTFFNNSSLQLKESWAVGVQWAFTKTEYGQFGDIDRFNDNLQKRTRREFWDWEGANYYTPMIVDMIDGDKGVHKNQRIDFLSNNYPFDDVMYYTLSELEHCLKHSTTFHEFKLRMQEFYPHNPTNTAINEYFNYWP